MPIGIKLDQNQVEKVVIMINFGGQKFEILKFIPIFCSCSKSAIMKDEASKKAFNSRNRLKPFC